MAIAYVEAAPDPRPGSRGYLRWWWTMGPGLRRWSTNVHPWTTLRRLLAKHIPDLPAQYLDQITSAWYLQVFHHPPVGSRSNPR